MIDKFFKKQPAPRKTGYYKVENNSLVEYDDLPGNGSINSITKELGYNSDQVSLINIFDSDSIQIIVVKIFTQQVVLVITHDKVSSLKMDTLNEVVRNTDWEKKFDSLSIEGILQSGIENKSLSFEYLNSVTSLEQDSANLYLAPSLNLYLSFENGLLQSFASSDWSNRNSKWVKNVNIGLFKNLLIQAQRHHDNEREAMQEVNFQCTSLVNMPDALSNKYIPLHTRANGSLNLYNLLAAHYPVNISIDEFKFVNKGRYIERSPNSLEVGKFIYHFSNTGEFISAIQK